MMTELMCLATAIFFEARDQPITGQELVAEVIINRVEHERFPVDVCSVVYQPKAFSFTHDGKSDDMDDYQGYQDLIAKRLAVKLASDYLVGGKRLGVTSTHYHTLEVSPFWADAFLVDGVFGDHVFYTCKGFC